MGKLVLTRNRIAKLKASPLERKRWFLLQKKSRETYVALNFLTTTMYSQIPYMGFKDKFELRLHLQKGRARRDLFSLVIALDFFACNVIIAQICSMPILFPGPFPEKKK